MEEERVRQVWECVTSALREQIRELAVTEDELHLAASYLNRVGTSDLFASLLDLAFAMTSVEVMDARLGGTSRTLEGPEYRPGAPLRKDGRIIERHEADAPLLRIEGRVSLLDETPARGAVIDVWQVDHHGAYDRFSWNLRGRIPVASDGNYQLETVMPSEYSQHEDDEVGELLRWVGRGNIRAAHIHFKIWLDGALRLTSQMFLPDSPNLHSDYVEGVVRDDLVLRVRRVEGTTNAYESRFDIVLP